MNDRFDDERLGERVRDSLARNAGRLSALPNTDDLFARVGVRAARQRWALAASAVALVAVASLVGYSIGTTVSRGDDGASVAAPPGEGEPDGVSSPTDVSGPLLHLFTRTVDGVTARVYVSPGSAVGEKVVVAEMSSDVAVGVGRSFMCTQGMAPGAIASGVFGAAEGDPVGWVVVSAFPDTIVRAQLGSRIDEMLTTQDLAVLLLRPDPAQPDQPVELELLQLDGSEHTDAPGIGPVTLGAHTDACTGITRPPAGPQPADVASADAGVRQAYADAFTGTNSPEVRSAAIEDGDQLAALAEQARLNTLEGGTTAEQLDAMTVETADLTFTDETHAVVLFTLRMPDWSGVSQRVGYAVLQDGRWKVARQTQCENYAKVGVPCP